MGKQASTRFLCAMNSCRNSLIFRGKSRIFLSSVVTKYMRSGITLHLQRRLSRSCGGDGNPLAERLNAVGAAAFPRKAISTRSLDLRAGAEIILADIKGLFKPEGLTRRSARFAKLAVKRGNFIRLLLQYDAGNVISPRKPRLPCHETEDDARFIVIFFTCAKHFRFIRIALASLQVWKPLVKTVYVYVDRMDPMSE